LALALIRPRAVRAEEQALWAEALAILALFGERLLPRQDQPAYSLSYANRRRLEIARWRCGHGYCCWMSRPPA
jgi:branched-chain amino acid transport system ATP-binding protein